jgi:hypothetical protein
MKITKLFQAFQQRTFEAAFTCLLAATLPQLPDRSVQKNRGHSAGQQRGRILSLHKGATAQGDNPRHAAAQFLQHLFQRRMLGSPEHWLPGVPENLSHRSPFALLDAVVKIFEHPIQVLCQGPANAGFSRTHESDQENRVA